MADTDTAQVEADTEEDAGFEEESKEDGGLQEPAVKPEDHEVPVDPPDDPPEDPPEVVDPPVDPVDPPTEVPVDPAVPVDPPPVDPADSVVPVDPLAAVEEREQTRVAEEQKQSHEQLVSAVEEKHPKVRDILKSDAFYLWLPKAPLAIQQKAEKSGNVQDACDVIEAFSAATGTDSGAQGERGGAGDGIAAKPAGDGEIDLAGIPQLTVKKEEGGEDVPFAQEYGEDVLRQMVAIVKHFEGGREVLDNSAAMDALQVELSGMRSEIGAVRLYEKIGSKHPDVRSVEASDEWKAWRGEQSAGVQAVSTGGDAEGRIMVLDVFKAHMAQKLKTGQGVEHKRTTGLKKGSAGGGQEAQKPGAEGAEDDEDAGFKDFSSGDTGA